jgi:hypothetical protein
VSVAKADVIPGNDRLGDQLWRLNNLYWITDKDGKKVAFRMNASQERLYWDLWYRTVILKARQRGFTTFLDILALDSCLFNENFNAGIIAHNLPDAQKIFRTKIRFPYDHLPDGLKLPIKVERAGEWEFVNGSTISVSTSFRSGTIQFLHVSEMGKIAAKYPEKAIEIVTGAFEAVPKNGMIAIESTAEGKAGKFYDIVTQAQDAADAGRELTTLDFKFFFEPWWKNEEYVLSPKDMIIYPRMRAYFDKLEADHGIKLTLKQKAWYIAKERTLGEDMKREYPSTPQEAFAVSLEGAYFKREMAQARRDGRIGLVPHRDGHLITTWWDIGRDTTSIWFTQDDGYAVNVIDFYQKAGSKLAHFKAIMDEKAKDFDYRYGPCMWPHDMGNEDWSVGKQRIEIARELGMDGEVLPRMATKDDGIEAARDFLSRCRFDEAKCAEGIDALDAYRKEWDDKLGMWKDKPLHDWASHPADAFQQMALYYDSPFHRPSSPETDRAVAIHRARQRNRGPADARAGY